MYLKRSIRDFALVLALALLILFTFGGVQGFAVEASTRQSAIQPAVPFALEELRPGMKGIGRTVAQGTAIEEFYVEVLGVLHGEQYVSQLVLVQVSGDVIERMGGIAGGMSGSPVYIDGKLLGAVSYTFSLTDHRLGLVTPIGAMLKYSTMIGSRRFGSRPPAAGPGPMAVSKYGLWEITLWKSWLLPGEVARRIWLPMMLGGSVSLRQLHRCWWADWGQGPGRSFKLLSSPSGWRQWRP